MRAIEDLRNVVRVLNHYSEKLVNVPNTNKRAVRLKANLNSAINALEAASLELVECKRLASEK